MENQYLEKILKAAKEFSMYGKFIPYQKRAFSLSSFKEKVISSPDFAPVFFLSTGRTGTQLFTKILKETKDFAVLHAPEPELIEQSKLAYSLYRQYNDSIEIEKLITPLLSHIYLVARERELYNSFCYKKTFVETNNRITFLAPSLKRLFPFAKFVYLYRHPGEFIRSGIRRGWYSGNHEHDTGRITPVDVSSEPYHTWNKWGSIEKIAWLWRETNEFIENFLSSIPDKDYIKINFNELNIETASNTLHFLGTELSGSKIGSLISQPVNTQKSGKFPVYENWSSSDQQKVKGLCSELCQKYGYNL